MRRKFLHRKRVSVKVKQEAGVEECVRANQGQATFYVAQKVKGKYNYVYAKATLFASPRGAWECTLVLVTLYFFIIHYKLITAASEQRWMSSTAEPILAPSMRSSSNICLLLAHGVQAGRQDWDIMGLEVRHQIIGDIAGCSLKMIDHAFFDEINCFVK